jgi:hypothetical protein
MGNPFMTEKSFIAQNGSMPDLFATPIRAKKIRKNVTAYQYENGCININGEKFFFYSMTEAIRIWRSRH